MGTDDRSRPDTFHIYVRHAGTPFFLAQDGSFIPRWEDARAFASWDEAFAALDALIGDRELGRDEPGIVANAWKWMEP